MKANTIGSILLLLCASLALHGPLFAKASPGQDNSQQPAPDNTKNNKRDRDAGSPTAGQQKMNPADREITKKIRMAIHDDNSLSTYAHNIKIITQDGRVTLKGPVRTEEEKSSIEAKATSVAGKGNVTNQLEIAPPKS
jgi:hyperosmotically inducible periplasmic protein